MFYISSNIVKETHGMANPLAIKRVLCVVFISILLLDGACAFSKHSAGTCAKCKDDNKMAAQRIKQNNIDTRRKCMYAMRYLNCGEQLQQQCREDVQFQADLTVMRSFRDKWNCSTKNITFDDTVEPGKTNTNRESCRRPNFKSKYKVCGLFGDPHLRTFSDKRHTCSVEGAWPLFANRFLTVQVTNIPLENGSRATATSKVTVIVKGNKKKCIEEKTYQARSNSLPKHFTDGTKSSGDKECPTTVKPFRKKRRIMIYICPLKTKIIIRQVGKYLTVHMRVPKAMTGFKTKGLCQRGCPPLEQMKWDKMSTLDKLIASLYKKDKLTKRVRRKRERRARKLCGNAKIRGFYYKSCFFDMLTSNDASFVKAAKKAMKDFHTINKDDKGRPIVNESERDYWTGPSVGTIPSSTKSPDSSSQGLSMSWYTMMVLVISVMGMIYK